MKTSSVVISSLVALSALFMACSEPQRTAEVPLTPEPDLTPVAQGFIASLSRDELPLVASLQTREALRFAVRQGDDSYQLQADGSIKGFDYHLAQAFAEALQMPAEFVVIDNISDFYADQEGFDPEVISDSSIQYQPRLFQQVDVLAGPLGVNPWRQRLSHMVPMHPASISITGKNAASIRQYQDMNGLSVAARPGDFMHGLLLNLIEQEQLQITIVEYQNEVVLQLLLDDLADLAIDGALFLARDVERIKQLEVSPLKLSVVPVAWAVDLEDTELQLLLARFIAHSLSTRLYHQLWSREMNIDFDLYLSIAGDHL